LHEATSLSLAFQLIPLSFFSFDLESPLKVIQSGAQIQYLLYEFGSARGMKVRDSNSEKQGRYPNLEDPNGYMNERHQDIGIPGKGVKYPFQGIPRRLLFY
jgi:hypothetical protein